MLAARCLTSGGRPQLSTLSSLRPSVVVHVRAALGTAAHSSASPTSLDLRAPARLRLRCRREAHTTTYEGRAMMATRGDALARPRAPRRATTIAAALARPIAAATRSRHRPSRSPTASPRARRRPRTRSKRLDGVRRAGLLASLRATELLKRPDFKNSGKLAAETARQRSASLG